MKNRAYILVLQIASCFLTFYFFKSDLEETRGLLFESDSSPVQGNSLGQTVMPENLQHPQIPETSTYNFPLKQYLNILILSRKKTK